jgi:transposase
MSVQHVHKWCREFKDGRTDVHDEQRSGRPLLSDETIAKVEETMLKDRRVTVRELCEMIPDVSKTWIDKMWRGGRVLRFRHKKDGTPHAKMH